MSMICQDVNHVEEWNIVPKKSVPRPPDYLSAGLGYIDLLLRDLFLHPACRNVPPVLDEEFLVSDRSYSYSHLLMPNSGGAASRRFQPRLVLLFRFLHWHFG